MRRPLDPRTTLINEAPDSARPSNKNSVGVSLCHALGQAISSSAIAYSLYIVIVDAWPDAEWVWGEEVILGASVIPALLKFFEKRDALPRSVRRATQHILDMGDITADTTAFLQLARTPTAAALPISGALATYSTFARHVRRPRSRPGQVSIFIAKRVFEFASAAGMTSFLFRLLSGIGQTNLSPTLACVFGALAGVLNMVFGGGLDVYGRRGMHRIRGKLELARRIVTGLINSLTTGVFIFIMGADITTSNEPGSVSDSSDNFISTTNLAIISTASVFAAAIQLLVEIHGAITELQETLTIEQGMEQPSRSMRRGDYHATEDALYGVRLPGGGSHPM